MKILLNKLATKSRLQMRKISPRCSAALRNFSQKILVGRMKKRKLLIWQTRISGHKSSLSVAKNGLSLPHNQEFHVYSTILT